jgi:hypothetical protein
VFNQPGQAKPKMIKFINKEFKLKGQSLGKHFKRLQLQKEVLKGYERMTDIEKELILAGMKPNVGANGGGNR